MAKTTYRVSNWSRYNQALVQRGNLTLWISEEAIEAWTYDGPAQQGAQYKYADLAIESCLRLRLVYDLPLRQTQGFVTSLFALMDLELPVPDYMTLSRRARDLDIDLGAPTKTTPDGEAVVTPRNQATCCSFSRCSCGLR